MASAVSSLTEAAPLGRCCCPTRTLVPKSQAVCIAELHTLYCGLSALESHLGLLVLVSVNVSVHLLHSAVQTGIEAHACLPGSAPVLWAGWLVLKDK